MFLRRFFHSSPPFPAAVLTALAAAAALGLTGGAPAAAQGNRDNSPGTRPLASPAKARPTPLPSPSAPVVTGGAEADPDATPGPLNLAPAPSPEPAPVLTSPTTPAAPTLSPEPPAPDIVPPAPGEYEPPVLVNRTPLSYPELARLNRISGVLKVLLTVDETGRVTDVDLLASSGSGVLDEAVRDAAFRNWTFRPARLRGKPVTGTFRQEVEFRPDPAQVRASDEQRAALPLTAGTPDPPYPAAALPQRPAGSVVVTVRWDERGLVKAITLLRSSGSPLLDRTALRFAFDHWRVNRAEIFDDHYTKTVRFVPPPPAPPAASAGAGRPGP